MKLRWLSFSLALFCGAALGAPGDCYEWAATCSTSCSGTVASGFRASVDEALDVIVSHCNANSTGCGGGANCSPPRVCTYTANPTVTTFPAYAPGFIGTNDLGATFVPGVTISTRIDPLGCPLCPPAGSRRILGALVGAGTSHCINGCGFSTPGTELTVTAAGASHGLRQGRSTGLACAAQSGEDNAGEDEDCMQVTGIGLVCAEDSPSKCASVNGDQVCPPQVPDDGCVEFASGAVACDSDSTSPPAPDNGTPGVPPAPDVQVTVNNITTNYYGGGTVAGSSAPPETSPPVEGGGPIGGDDDVGEGEGSVTGGLSCTAAPVCEGDALTCAVIAQQWRTRCVESPTDPELLAAFGETVGESEDLIPIVGELELPSALNAVGWIGNDCPSDISIVLGGDLPTVSIPVSMWCEWLGIFGVMVMVGAYIGGIKIILGGI